MEMETYKFQRYSLEHSNSNEEACLVWKPKEREESRKTPIFQGEVTEYPLGGNDEKCYIKQGVFIDSFIHSN